MIREREHTALPGPPPHPDHQGVKEKKTPVVKSLHYTVKESESSEGSSGLMLEYYFCKDFQNNPKQS